MRRKGADAKLNETKDLKILKRRRSLSFMAVERITVAPTEKRN